MGEIDQQGAALTIRLLGKMAVLRGGETVALPATFDLPRR